MSDLPRYARDLGAPSGYSVTLHELLARLPDTAEGLAGALEQLRRDPTPDRCDLLTIRFAGAQTLVRRIVSELLREESPTV